jgi:hypothetical protein
MSMRVRGQECSLNIIVDGDMKGGSFVKVTNFNVTPETEIVNTDFIGEIESDLDIHHSGFAFDFEVEYQDSNPITVMELIVERERMRLPHPDINLVATFKYRSLAGIPGVIVLEHCFMKLDNITVGGRKDYVKSKFSGKCKTCPQLL